MQPVERDEHGVIRFRANAIVRELLDAYPGGLNHLALKNFSAEDHMQLAQLIGYSVSGYGDLSCASPESIAEADAIAEKLL